MNQDFLALPSGEESLAIVVPEEPTIVVPTLDDDEIEAPTLDDPITPPILGEALLEIEIPELQPKFGPPVKTVRLNQDERNQLIQLKKKTKIETYNIIARWCFCYSLSIPQPPSPTPVRQGAALEMTWDTFAGDLSAMLIIALKQYCHNQGLEITPKVLGHQFRLHLHRGISYAAYDRNIKTIEDFISLATNPRTRF